MTPDFSEFSYGFALLNEIVGWTPLAVAPILPSLIEEGSRGYDVQLELPGVPLYLQFKRANFMQRRNSKLRKKTKLRAPYYRFKIMERLRSRQHQLLYELDKGSNLVYYAAPRFHELSELNLVWSAKRISERSIFVRPSDIGELDDDAHSVAYDADTCYVFSEPKHLSHKSAYDVLSLLQERLSGQARPIREALPDLIRNANEAEKRTNQKEQNREYRREVEKLNRARGIDHRESISDSFNPAKDMAPDGEPPVISKRPARELSGPESQLRQLADIAARDFDCQLFVAQTARPSR